MTYFDLETDLPKERKLKIDETEVVLVSTDPYGLWAVRFEKGTKTPKELKGHYTSPWDAEKAVKSYLNTTKKTIAS